jgi:signal transduction histidine kinase
LAGDIGGRSAEIRDYRFFSDVRGSEIIYDADFTPLYDQPGSIVGAICILHETTERHRMEHLAKLETVAQLTGGVAHDFNNLMTAAMGCLEMILCSGKNQYIQSLADTALRSLDRGAQLTQQLLAFARRQTLRPVSAHLNDLLAEIEVLIRRAVGETIDVVIEPGPNLPQCEVDPAQFEAAVMNLVINARDAMPNGGRIRLSTREIRKEEIPAGLDLSTWRLRRIHSQGQWRGHEARGHGPSHRTVLYDQGDRQGIGARFIDGVRFRQTIRG